MKKMLLASFGEYLSDDEMDKTLKKIKKRSTEQTMMMTFEIFLYIIAAKDFNLWNSLYNALGLILKLE